LKEQKKAWLFVLWATGPEAQWEAFTKFYGTPTRKSLYDKARGEGWLEEDSEFRKAQHLRPQEIELSNHLDGFDIGPKVPYYSEYLDVAGGELSKFVSGKTATAKQCLDSMKTRLDKIAGV
jgi:ABC-type glycerol-3-phosphate transport system substrate-binding protein